MPRSHRGRFPGEPAFARLAGCAPIPASSGQTIRYRLDRGGDRQLNRTLHIVIVTRRRNHAPTIAYINRRTQDGKSSRKATRCLKRYLARNLYRLLDDCCCSRSQSRSRRSPPFSFECCGARETAASSGRRNLRRSRPALRRQAYALFRWMPTPSSFVSSGASSRSS